MKPNIEYLDSLNDYRKRSRSREDIGTGSSSPKQRRTSPPESVAELANGVSSHVEAPAPVSAEDDPIVYGTSAHYP